MRFHVDEQINVYLEFEFSLLVPGLAIVLLLLLLLFSSRLVVSFQWASCLLF
jgi:hypothetical protein